MSDVNPSPPTEATLDLAHSATVSVSGPPAQLDRETPVQALARAHAAALARRFGEALGICDDVLKTMPDHPEALALLGIISSWAGDPDRGVGLLKRAIQLQPGHAHWVGNLSLACRATYRMDEALAAGQEAVRLDPSPVNLVNLSLIFSDMDDREQSVVCLLRALQLKHDHVDGHLGLAENLLAVGDFGPGWIEYEWRNLTEAGKRMLPAMPSAAWNGMRIPNGRLVLVGDQGYGDMIQFARYIPMAAERCKEVVLVCAAEMEAVLGKVAGVERFCRRYSDVPRHAAHCVLSSLPYLFHTVLDTIPDKVPYLKADPARVAHWRDQLEARLPPGVKRIGLAWTGRPTHPNNWRRSLPLSRLVSLSSAGPAAFISIQKPMPASDQASLARFPHMAEMANEPMDFGETAAVMENLDLIITVDTAMAHLAGALARPVWILLSKAADWRWLLGRSDTPWYPTARLFRQETPGAWDAVINQVGDALTRELGADPNPSVGGPDKMEAFRLAS
jgi:Glycosyltransferase family 9 (heptosyltransferase)